MHMRKMMVHALDEHGTQALNSNQRQRWWAWVLSHVQFFETPWTVAHQTPLSMGFHGQEYWSGLSFPPPGDLPDPEMEPTSSPPTDTGRWVLSHQHHLGNKGSGTLLQTQSIQELKAWKNFKCLQPNIPHFKSQDHTFSLSKPMLVKDTFLH